MCFDVPGLIITSSPRLLTTHSTRGFTIDDHGIIQETNLLQQFRHSLKFLLGHALRLKILSQFINNEFLLTGETVNPCAVRKGSSFK